MKKPLIFASTLIATLFLSSAATLAINNTTQNGTDNTPQNLVAVNSNLTTDNINKLSTKDANIYTITDTTGTVNKTFIGNTIANEETLPVELQIQYYLDGTEISASELAGKSGHVKIIYNFSATSTYQNKLVPFLTVTGLNFDSTKFSNIKIDRGKIISESDSITLVGYTFAGLSQDLNADFLPSNFTIEADTTNFELGTVYSFATNELFAELDTSKLTSVDSIISSINSLSNGLDQIIAGSNDLTNGIDTLATGISKLQLGANNLESGANNLATGITKLSNGLNSVVAFDNEILAKAYGVVDQVTATTENLIAKYDLDPALVAELTAPIVEYYNKINTAITTYTGNIETLANGASELSVGANNLAAGTTELKNGINSLSAGAAQLSAGSHTLKQGLNTFKASGIDKLVNFANQDAANFVYNFRQTVSAAKSYTTHTKFIFKTPSIK